MMQMDAIAKKIGVLAKEGDARFLEIGRILREFYDTLAEEDGPFRATGAGKHGGVLCPAQCPGLKVVRGTNHLAFAPLVARADWT